VALTTALLIFTVITLGGFVRALGAGMACGPDWPTCKGYIIPPDILNPFVLLEYVHRVAAALALLFTLITVTLAWTRYPGNGGVRLWATTTILLLAFQVVVGMVVVKTELELLSSALHLTMATATFGAATVLSVVAFRADQEGSAR
jgi:heme A synthase